MPFSKEIDVGSIAVLDPDMTGGVGVVGDPVVVPLPEEILLGFLGELKWLTKGFPPIVGLYGSHKVETYPLCLQWSSDLSDERQTSSCVAWEFVRHRDGAEDCCL